MRVFKMDRLIVILVSFIVFMNFSCSSQVTLGNAEIPVPTAWKKIVEDKNRINLLSPDEHQQATISVMRFGASSTLDDFKRICENRLKAEKADAPEITVSGDEPFVDAGTFGMFFSGNEKSASRTFSGYLTLKDKELITIYLESIDVDSKRHLQTFEGLVKGFKWR